MSEPSSFAKASADQGKKPPRWTISKSPSGRVQPAWVPYFLRALARTGDVRAAAEDAGIDHSTAYARRRAHPEFALAWEEALVAHEASVKRKEAEEIAALNRAPSTIASSGNGPPPRSGEELVGGAAQLKRAGEGRWSQAKEKLFFDELAATANVKRAASAAGVSTNAVYARRMKHPLFRAKWEAVLETGRAAIEMKLVEAANKSFDPEELDVGDVDVTLGNRPPDGRVGPVVSVAEAIRIVQLQGSRTQRAALPDPFKAQADTMGSAEIDEVRERLFKKFMRLKQRAEAERLAEGWSYDEAHGLVVPPGWVRGRE